MTFLTPQNYTFSLVSSFLGVCGMVIPLDLVQLNISETDLAHGGDYIYFAEVFWRLQRHYL